MDDGSPLEESEEPENGPETDEGPAGGGEDAQDPPVDASTGGNPGDSEPTDDDKKDGFEDDDSDGWRWLSRGPDSRGRKRFQMALGSGRQRQWRGELVIMDDSEDNYIIGRNKDESDKQRRQKDKINRTRQQR